VGGLAFTTFRHPEMEEASVWINALRIVPTLRRKGLATKLIEEAQNAASELGIGELFVQTEYPDLYRRLGWTELEKSSSGSILGRDV
jgi:N-acetylglutamate synthase-like GNAT family acetyltransferase